jgi:hypothetical protein
LALAILGAAAVLAPRASASIIYSICTSGCTATGGSYSSVQTAAPGLAYSSTIAFTAGNLSSGIYTDPTTGVIFTSMNGGSTDTFASVSGTSLVQGVHGTGTGIQIALPANTFAISFNYTDSSFYNGGLVVNGTDVNSTNFLIQQAGGFASIVSSTAISSVFIGGSSAGNLGIANFQAGTSAPSDGGGGDAPEPSTLILIGSGLCVAGFARHRQQRG